MIENNSSSTNRSPIVPANVKLPEITLRVIIWG